MPSVDLGGVVRGRRAHDIEHVVAHREAHGLQFLLVGKHHRGPAVAVVVGAHDAAHRCIAAIIGVGDCCKEHPVIRCGEAIRGGHDARPVGLQADRRDVPLVEGGASRLAFWRGEDERTLRLGPSLRPHGYGDEARHAIVRPFCRDRGVRPGGGLDLGVSDEQHAARAEVRALYRDRIALNLRGLDHGGESAHVFQHPQIQLTVLLAEADIAIRLVHHALEHSDRLRGALAGADA